MCWVDRMILLDFAENTQQQLALFINDTLCQCHILVFWLLILAYNVGDIQPHPVITLYGSGSRKGAIWDYGSACPAFQINIVIAWRHRAHRCHWPCLHSSHYLLKAYEWVIATVIFGRRSSDTNGTIKKIPSPLNKDLSASASDPASVSGAVPHAAVQFFDCLTLKGVSLYCFNNRALKGFIRSFMCMCPRSSINLGQHLSHFWLLFL